MEETRYIVEEEYPDGHDMGYNEYGPATEAELHERLVPDHMRHEDFLDLMSHGEHEPVHSVDGSGFRLVPVREHVVVVTWQDPEDGVSVYGPYTWAEAEAAIPKIKRFFVSPFASAEERAQCLANQPGTDGEVFSAKQCADMGYEWGGVIPDGVIFDIVGLEKP